MRIGSIKYLTAFVFMVAGCAAEQTLEPPSTTAQATNEARPGPQGPGAEGVTGAASPPYTLKQCIDIALRNNPDVAAGRFGVQAAQADRDSTAAQRWPVLGLDAGYRSYRNDQRLVMPRYGNEPGVYGPDIATGNLVLSMPIFTSGRIQNQIKAADLIRQSAGHGLARTRRELVFNVSQVFYRILAQKHILASLDFSKRALAEHRKRVSDMMAVQKAARVDLLRTEVRLADIEQRRVAEANVMAILHRVLANLLALSETPTTLTIQGELALTAVDANLPAARTRAYAQRADYQAVQAEVAAQTHGLKLARAGHWPVISAEASYGLRSSVDPTTRPAGTDQTEDVGFVGVRALWPLFEGGAINARIRREQARLLQQQERLRKLKLQIDLDIETAHANLTSAQERVAATEASITQARESLRIEQERYALGKGSMTDVLDAQSALLAAQTNYYHAESDTHTAVAQWHLALGDEL